MAERNSMYTYQWVNETKKDDKSFIRIYGISDTGDNICVRVRGFKRYVYVELPSKAAETAVSRMAKDKGAVSTKLLMRHHLYYFNKDKRFPFVKCSFTTLQQLSHFVASIRYSVMIPGVGRVKLKVHEDHATPVLQLISTQNLKMSGWLDFTGKLLPKEDQLTSCAKEYVVDYKELRDNDRKDVIEPKVLSFDLEVNSENINCMPCDKPGDRIFQISCVFNDGRNILLTLPKCNDLEGVTVMTFAKEKDLIVGFIELLKNEKPNIITGYNILSFDIPYLMKRCKRYYLTEDLKLAGFNTEAAALSKEVSWSSAAFKNQHFEFIDWEGILLFDLLPIVQRDYKIDNYKLNTVAAKFVGAEKDPLTPKDIFAAYRKGEVTEVGKYCIKDSVLVLKLFNHLQVWVAFSEMAKVCNVGMFTLYTQGQQIKIYSQVYKYCFDKKIVVDTDGYTATSDEKYRGASVLEPDPGYYEDVVPFDFSSLYPSLMQAWNICFSSAVNDESVPDELCHVFEWDDHVGCDHDQKIIDQRQLKARIDKIVETQKKIREERDAIKMTTVLQEVKKSLQDGEMDLGCYLQPQIMKEARVKYNNAKSTAYKSVRELDPFIEEAIKREDDDTLRELLKEQQFLERNFNALDIETYKQRALEKIQEESLRITKKRTALEKDITRVVVAKRKQEFNNTISKLNDEAKPLREERENLVKTKPDKPMCAHRRYRFYKAEVQMGVIPTIITELLQARKTVRAKIKETDDPLEKVVYDKQQLAYKVSANSMYGGMGAQRGMLVYMPGAMCVTMKGREALAQAQQLLTQKHGATLVYGDTDCVQGAVPVLLQKDGDLTYQQIEDIGDGDWKPINRLKEIATVQKGTKIWSDSGWTDIKNIVRCKIVKPLTRVFVHTGEVTCSNEHSLLKEDKTQVSSKDLAEGDALCISDLPMPEDTPGEPFFQKAITREDIMSFQLNTHEEGMAFTRGLFFAAGSCGSYHKQGKTTKVATRWAINNQDHELLEKIRPYLDSEYHTTFKILEIVKPSNVLKLVPYGLNMKEFVSQWRELFYSTRKYKKVPTYIMNSPYRVRKAFFMGYYAGVGDKNRDIKFSNKGPIGSAGLFFLARSLGYKICINIRNDKPEVYELVCSSPSEKFPHTPNKIKKIIELKPEDTQEEYVYDIETGNHHFSAGVGELVVHNSCYVKFPWITDPTELWDHCIKVEKELLPHFPPPMKLAFEEVIYRKFLILSKKRYMWQSCERDGVLGTKVGRKGVLLARRDNSKFTRDVYEKIMAMMFDKVPKHEIESWLTDKLDNLFRGELHLQDYVITKSVGDTSGDYEEETSTLGSYKVKALSDDPDERKKQLKGRTEREYYVSSMPAQVRLAERMRARGFPVDAGSRIEYVVLKRTCAQNQGDKIEELEYYKERKHLLKIDPTYYLETLQKPLDQLCKAGLKDPRFMTNHEKYRMNHQKMILQLKNTFVPKIVKMS